MIYECQSEILIQEVVKLSYLVCRAQDIEEQVAHDRSLDTSPSTWIKDLQNFKLIWKRRLKWEFGGGNGNKVKGEKTNDRFQDYYSSTMILILLLLFTMCFKTAVYTSQTLIRHLRVFLPIIIGLEQLTSFTQRDAGKN